MNMNIEALQQMIRVLEQVENDPVLVRSFDLGTWTRLPSDTDWTTSLAKLAEGEPSKLSIVSECGTTACACGFAAIDPWFRNQGFRFERSGGYMSEIRLYEHPDDEYWHSDWDAVTQFFGLSYTTAQKLFSSSTYMDKDGAPMLDDEIQPSDVIARIRTLLTTNEI